MTHKIVKFAKKNHSDVIRNLPKFLAAYFKSESGKRALARKPRYNRKDGLDSGSNQMAVAFQQALIKIGG